MNRRIFFKQLSQGAAHTDKIDRDLRNRETHDADFGSLVDW